METQNGRSRTCSDSQEVIVTEVSPKDLIGGLKS